MMLDWFNAREAVTVGSSLADSFLRDRAAPPKENGTVRTGAQNDVQRILRRAAPDARALKLNLFKRAKLLGSFKWRLIEQGIDQADADQLTHLLLMQLNGGGVTPPVDPATSTPSSVKAARKRIDPLLQGVDADFAKGEYAEAAAKLQEVLAIDPQHAFAHNKLGDALTRLGQYADAEREFRRAIQIEPRRVDAHFNLGTLLRWHGDFLGSETTLRRAVKLDPRSANALTGLGHTLSALDKVSEARSCFEKALRLSARDAGAYCGLAWLTSMDGGFEEAESLLRKALEVDSACSEALALLVDQRRMTQSDRQWLDDAHRMLARNLPPVEEARLRFAMGKFCDDVGNYAAAFDQYRQAAKLRKQMSIPYVRAHRVAWVDDVIRLYTADCIGHPAEVASDSQQPVFVVGMMRSGTSLVEQIIASHPQAAGAGELDFWSVTAHKHPDVLRHRLPDDAFARKLTDAYLKALRSRSTDAERIVDKAPVNSEYLGLIHRVFPHARFIYMRRDPIDTCLSCYFQDFANTATFTMDLGDLAHYYREHHRLVAHWRSVLPKDVFLDVPYAELVADQEGWSRKIIEFIGLPWDPRVLEFHKTQRAVLTASHWQVRQKMYSSSIGRWKNYQKFIGPLLDLRKLG